MSTNFYIKCSPMRVSFTGVIPFGAFLAQMRLNGLTSCEFTPVVTGDKENEIGILTGSGTDLSNILDSYGEKFNLKRLMENEFIGACKIYYKPETSEDVLFVPTTFEQHMENYSIDVSSFDLLECVKAYKTNLFKEISKRKFYDDNDAIADAMKCLMMLAVYKDEDFTPEQIANRDSFIQAAKMIYTPSVCIDGASSMVALLQEVLIGYYTAKSNLEAATSIEDALNIEY